MTRSSPRNGRDRRPDEVQAKPEMRVREEKQARRLPSGLRERRWIGIRRVEKVPSVPEKPHDQDRRSSAAQVRGKIAEPELLAESEEKERCGSLRPGREQGGARTFIYISIDILYANDIKILAWAAFHG